MIGDPPSKSPSSQAILICDVVVNKSDLVNYMGGPGTVADTALPPTGDGGPSPTLLKAITLTSTAAPYSRLNGGPCNVAIGIMQLADAITS